MIVGVYDKDDILQEIESARADLLSALDGLTPDQMRMAGAVGVWSVKDVLAHIVAWESEVVTALNKVLNKRVPAIIHIDDIDEWNEKQYHISVRRSLDVIIEDFYGVHKMLLHMLEDFDDKILSDNRRFAWMEGEPLAYLIEENVTLHEREHAEDIRVWREHEGFAVNKGPT